MLSFLYSPTLMMISTDEEKSFNKIQHPLMIKKKTSRKWVEETSLKIIKAIYEIDYILCRQRWRDSIQSAQTRPGADCGSDHQLLTVKFRLKLKKAGKTTRPFRYDLNPL